MNSTNLPASPLSQPSSFQPVGLGLGETGIPKKATILPLIASIVVLVLSLSIQVFQYQLANNAWYLVGYILTPLLVTMGLAWDTLAQRKGRKSPWFEAKPIYSKILRLVVAVGFVIAVFHIVAIGIQIGEQVVQSGVS